MYAGGLRHGVADDGVTGVKAVRMDHDISTVTGEEVVEFTLAEPPGFREMKKS